MAIEYTLRINQRNEQLDHAAIRKALTEAFSEVDDGSWFGNPNGLILTVLPDWDEDDLAERHQVELRKALGFPYRGIFIGFCLQGDHEESARRMVRIVNWVLAHYEVDAKFSFDEAHRIRLFRSHGRVVLVDADFWQHDAVLQTLITLPYEYRKASVNYSLTICMNDRTVNPAIILGRIIAKFQLLPRHECPESAIGEGLIVEPYNYDSPTSSGTDHGSMGPQLVVTFEIDVLSYDAGLAKLVAITRWALDQYAGDATLEWYPEWNVQAPPLLTRTDNKITLSDEPDFWTPERKAIILGKPQS
ncbi:MAG: hypothetical protein IPM54_38625 [Polyangiaceae bacterium]|nr:hypothetical protein [Polyangiaceae bacterium]